MPSSTPWTQARARFRTLATACADHECDPLTVLTLPVLSDVSVPSTARFVDAFAEAQARGVDPAPRPAARLHRAGAIHLPRPVRAAPDSAADRPLTA